MSDTSSDFIFCSVLLSANQHPRPVISHLCGVIISCCLFLDMRPGMATQQQSGLPVYILFMCIRHTDYMNNDDKVRSLLTNIINCIKKTVKVTYHHWCLMKWIQ